MLFASPRRAGCDEQHVEPPVHVKVLDCEKYVIFFFLFRGGDGRVCADAEGLPGDYRFDVSDVSDGACERSE